MGLWQGWVEESIVTRRFSIVEAESEGEAITLLKGTGKITPLVGTVVVDLPNVSVGRVTPVVVSKVAGY